MAKLEKYVLKKIVHIIVGMQFIFTIVTLTICMFLFRKIIFK